MTHEVELTIARLRHAALTLRAVALRMAMLGSLLSACGNGKPELVAVGQPCRPFEPRVYFAEDNNTYECVCFLDGCVWSWCRAGDFTVSPENCR